MFEGFKFLDYILLVFLSFMIAVLFFGPLNLKIENLEKFHINDVCGSCGGHLNQ